MPLSPMTHHRAGLDVQAHVSQVPAVGGRLTVPPSAAKVKRCTMGRAAITVCSTGHDLIDQQAVLSGGSAETGPPGVRYFYGYLSQGKSVGEALQLAKDDLLVEYPGNSYANPDYRDVVNSYEAFGDPSQTVP